MKVCFAPHRSNSANGRLGAIFFPINSKAVKGFEKLIIIAEKIGEESLPKTFDAALLESITLSANMKADLQLVLPRFAKILEWLGVIGEMLERDEPLKPSLLIFSRIYEQINEMMSYINNLAPSLSE